METIPFCHQKVPNAATVTINVTPNIQRMRRQYLCQAKLAYRGSSRREGRVMT
jgi:hypothetical protein